MSQPPNSRKWSVWEDREPPNPPITLHVAGEVETPATNIVPRLTRRAPQGINPKILMLDLSLEDTGGPGEQVVSYLPVKYEEEVELGQHSQVQIMWEEDEIKLLDVEVVH
jgi:hypothetical protein